MLQSVPEAGADCFSCSLCLDVLKDPVTIPCGHSYCMPCIKACWDKAEDQGIGYSCPQCRGLFSVRPVLNRNTVLTEVLEGVNTTISQTANTAVKLEHENGEECHFCIGEKRAAVKSCLTCVASFCETHLRPHLEFPVLQRHTLVEPSSRLQEKMCPLHNKLLDVFCVQDKCCICILCAMDEHSDHKTVSASKEWSQQQKALQKMQETFSDLLQLREKELQTLNKAVKTYSTSAQAAVELGKDFMTAITQSMEKEFSKFTDVIQAYEKKELCRAEDLQKKLEETIACLKRSDAECKQLRDTDDHILCLQKYLSLSAFSESVSAHSNPLRHNPSFLNATALLSERKEELKKIIHEKMEEMTSAATKIKVLLPANPKTREEFKEHLCQLKLCPESNHTCLKLSGENKKVEFSRASYNHYFKNPNPKRFTNFYQVLCDSAVEGCCYWEVMVSGNVHIALAYDSIVRNSYDGQFGYNDQSWSLECDQYSCQFRHNQIATEISTCSPSNIGVYLDKDAGMLAFYSISDHGMMLLHRTKAVFTKPLYPGFTLKQNSSVTLC